MFELQRIENSPRTRILAHAVKNHRLPKRRSGGSEAILVSGLRKVTKIYISEAWDAKQRPYVYG